MPFGDNLFGDVQFGDVALDEDEIIGGTMGNFIFGYSLALDNKFVDYTASASTENSAYPASNVKIFGHTTRHWRSTVVTESWVMQAFGSAKIIVGIALYDVNFTSAYIEGSADGSTWGFSQAITITQNPWTQRYQVYIPLTGFNYAYLRVCIPAQSRTDSAAYFRMGSFVPVDTIVTLGVNPSFPYRYGADEKILTNTFESGAEEDVVLSGLIWNGTFGFQNLEKARAADIVLLNKAKKNGILVMYENGDDPSAVFICRRRSEIQLQWDTPSTIQISDITFKEVA